MSFASETKKELVQIQSDDCCAKAELSALIRMNGVISLSNKGLVLDFATENAAIARRTLQLIKQLFDTEVDLLSRKKMQLKKNNVYIIRIKKNARDIATELGIMSESVGFVLGIAKDLVEYDCCKRAYMRGAFLAGGSVNNPETSSYHFEISTLDQELAEDLKDLANVFNLNARVLQRKKGYIMYIKEAEKISDFLRVIEAYNAVLNFEDVRIFRDIRNSENRLNNCEIANETKTIVAAQRQIDNIELIDFVYGIDSLPERLQHVAKLRLEFPEENLNYLSDISNERGFKLTKSGINHRMRKLAEMAEEIRDNQKKRLLEENQD
ncbi:DNA-binding protein WhiA [Turicibacter sanguinis]|uniref:DNA-binding protein WhiA n=1 Tax=Turicibacter sanguinis TaxID=154288 RepID=UPI00105021B9|nr:DNA-binding protein WhiA [Turicibacter sanguinis]MCU7211549.1 DNA-binding protein WhiA [Turicibacter sanguinis]MDB8459169.1 DNA-binding protein WhiA [Turicibacter sanguinis]MTP71337.1 DNA-binding protein WhiA [Turicibacter sanguinis]QJS19008.1 DNA-binding protein WhiA [Turicibacter sanguinis]